MKLHLLYMQDVPSGVHISDGLKLSSGVRSSTTDEDEDEEALMQRALALSMQDSSSSSTEAEVHLSDVRISPANIL